MPDRDTALIIAALGLPQHLIEVPPRRIEIEIQVQIDIDVEGLRKIEQLFELRHRVGVHVRTTADQIAAIAQGGDQKLLGAVIVGEPLLRKDADRKIDRPGVVALEHLDRLNAAQSDARIDLDMGPHPRGAVNDGALEHAGAAGIDVLDREVALHAGDGANGLIDAAVIMPTAAEQAGLVEVNVGVDKAGQHQPAVDMDFGGLRLQTRRDRDNPAIGYADVDGRIRRQRRRTAKDQVKSGSRVHGSGKSGMKPRLSEVARTGSSRLCACLGMNCSNYVHAI